MTDTVTVNFTRDEITTLMDVFTAAGNWHAGEVEKLRPIVGVYDLSIATVDRMHGHELQARKMHKAWVQFYQLRRQLPEGGAA